MFSPKEQCYQNNVSRAGLETWGQNGFIGSSTALVYTSSLYHYQNKVALNCFSTLKNIYICSK